MTFFEFITSPLMGAYFLCAVFGGTLILLQLLLMFAGAGGDGDFGDGADNSADTGTDGSVDGHGHSADIFKVLSLRTIIAGIAFFGLGGLAGLTGGTSQPVSVIIAVICGLLAVYTVYYLYLSAAKLKSDGSISNETLAGSSGSVYLRIPAAKAGTGKVLVNQQGRTMEYEAITAGEELKVNTPITVVRAVSSTIVEVAAV